MNPKLAVLAGLLLVLAACSVQSPAPAESLEGAWRLTGMHLLTADGKDIELPARESLVIFADGYYSIGYAFGATPVPYARRWEPSDDEKVARFSSVIVNSGSYRLSGSRIIARPLFALAPEFVDGEAGFSYEFKDGALELTWDRSVAFDGLEYPSRGTVILLRLVRADQPEAPVTASR